MSQAHCFIIQIQVSTGLPLLPVIDSGKYPRELITHKGQHLLVAGLIHHTPLLPLRAVHVLHTGTYQGVQVGIGTKRPVGATREQHQNMTGVLKRVQPRTGPSNERQWGGDIVVRSPSLRDDGVIKVHCDDHTPRFFLPGFTS